MFELLPFGAGAWTVIFLYIGSLLLFGWYGYRSRTENTLNDFYLAGPGFGFVVLLLTLYATQYSGNVFFAFTGMTYRIGFSWIMSTYFMLAIVVFYLVYALRLRTLSKQHGFITPVDYLAHRFRSNTLNLLAALVMIVSLSNFLLAQLMAMGRALQGMAGGNPDIAYTSGVIVLALIMVVYGTLGGLRAVAWTDVVQGIVLFIGFLLLIASLLIMFGPLSVVTNSILNSPDANKVILPDANRMREWLSYILLVGMGGALYPQAIQRIYASRSGKVLRHSLASMAILQVFATLIALIAGIYAIAHVPGLEGVQTDQVLTRIFRLLQEDSVFGYWLVVILFAAIISAMMSTADSALLTISSMITKDIYAGYFRSNASQAELTRIGKLCSWALIVFLTWLAIMLKDKASLISLIDRKFDLLVQLAPAFMLSIRWSNLRAGPVVIGLVAGLSISLALAFGPFEFVRAGKVWGFHPGLYGLAINLGIAVGGSLLLHRTENESPAL